MWDQQPQSCCNTSSAGAGGDICVTEGCGCHSPAHTWFVVFRIVLSIRRYLLFQDFLSQRDSWGCKWSVGHGRALISCHCSLWVIIRLLRIKIEIPDVQKCSCQRSM